MARSLIEANLAQEQAVSQLLLLPNIARTQERMPMHFSQIGQVRHAPGGWGWACRPSASNCRSVARETTTR